MTIPLLTELPYRPDSAALFEAVADRPWAVFLDSGLHYPGQARYDIIAAELGQRNDGTYDGMMTSVPPTGETRAYALEAYAKSHGISLAESVAYADSSSDLPMLEAVGFPVAVNPETRLASIARKRGWLIEDFHKAPGAPGRLLPIAPPRRGAIA